MNTSPRPTSIPAGGQATFTVAFQSTGCGTRTVTLQVLSDDPSAAISTITLAGRGLTPRESWGRIYFNRIDNSGDAADDNDYEADGHVNFAEYA